jgi:hypothetical protein
MKSTQKTKNKKKDQGFAFGLADGCTLAGVVQFRPMCHLIYIIYIFRPMSNQGFGVRELGVRELGLGVRVRVMG